MTTPSLYLETSVISYLTARSSRDLITAAHQQVTRDWWDTKSAFDVFISQFVIDEASIGDPDAAARRLRALEGLPILDITDDARLLANEILQQGGMPSKAYVDAAHVALAAVHGIDYLLTWNCKHIANPAMRGKVEAICRSTGFDAPVICTPVEFMYE